MDRGEKEHGSTRSERHKIKRTDDFDQGGGVGKRNDKEKGIWNEYLLFEWPVQLPGEHVMKMAGCVVALNKKLDCG